MTDDVLRINIGSKLKGLNTEILIGIHISRLRIWTVQLLFHIAFVFGSSLCAFSRNDEEVIGVKRLLTATQEVVALFIRRNRC